ncbi:TetR/AcrR family transcriptional regulator C-terminal domain-containing protein [Streptomyces sp. NPDC006514]|uniref:TetR/AcrR family transcriptional regulator C-terminal domain-containing protein n=1 Tax=Streptomyces sp. NPDC006514 TaxID=3154308 RepID=UPI0033A8C316
MHDALTAWPWAAEVLSADGFVGLLDESAMWMVEAIVAGADDHGCTPEQSVDVFRSIWYYTVGEVLVRAHSARRRDEGQPLAYRDDLDPAQVPHLAAIGVRWAALAARDIYPQGLRTFVDGLLARATPPRYRLSSDRTRRARPQVRVPVRPDARVTLVPGRGRVRVPVGIGGGTKNVADREAPEDRLGEYVDMLRHACATGRRLTRTEPATPAGLAPANGKIATTD